MIAYVMILAGVGEADIKLIDQEAWDYLDTGIPTDSVLAAHMQSSGVSREQAHDEMSLEDAGEGDRAMALFPSIFNGEQYKGTTVKEMFDFVQKHGIQLHEHQYEGHLY